MNDLPEHKRGPIKGLDTLDAEIEELENRLRDCRFARQSMIDAVAQSIAKYKVGDEYENRKGWRFRITKVKGDYMDVHSFNPEPIVFVRYRGVRLYKKGTEGREVTLYPRENVNGS